MALREQPLHLLVERVSQIGPCLRTDLGLARQRVAPPGAARQIKTAIPVERLLDLHRALMRVPAGFTLHPKLERIREQRQQAVDRLDERTIDWALAEELALASILEDGVAIRLTGEDVTRVCWRDRAAPAKVGTPFASPIGWLRRQVAPDGHIASPNDAFPPVNTFATSQGIQALRRGWLPIAWLPPRPC